MTGNTLLSDCMFFYGNNSETFVNFLRRKAFISTLFFKQSLKSKLKQSKFRLLRIMQPDSNKKFRLILKAPERFYFSALNTNNISLHMQNM